MITGNDLRKKFIRELNTINYKTEDIKPILTKSNLENIKELIPEIEIDGFDEKRFSLFTPASSLEKNYLAHATYLSLNVKENKPIKILESESSIHLTLKLEKSTSYDLIILMKGGAKSLFVEAFLSEDAHAKITCISHSGKVLIRYFSHCEKNSTFDAKTLSLSSTDAESKIILEDGASGTMISSFLNKDDESRLNDVMVHKGKDSGSKILSKSYLINSKLDSRGLIRIEPSAFNAQGNQESNALLEGRSKIISVPDLEILNNEVKCSHGSIVSRVKDEDLFYFQSRGIALDDARLMMIKGHLLSDFQDIKIKEIAQRALDGEL